MPAFKPVPGKVGDFILLKACRFEFLARLFIEIAYRILIRQNKRGPPLGERGPLLDF